jgi:hypothetical protein
MVIGLTLDQFWEMTPHEFNLAVGAHGERQDAEWQRTATLGAWILNGLGVKPKVTAARLLGRSKDLSRMTGDQIMKYYEEKKRRNRRMPW